MDSSPAPGKARLNMMTPTIVFGEGKPPMALGAPGGNAIFSAPVQTISNLVDFDLRGGTATDDGAAALSHHRL